MDERLVYSKVGRCQSRGGGKTRDVRAQTTEMANKASFVDKTRLIGPANLLSISSP